MTRYALALLLAVAACGAPAYPKAPVVPSISIPCPAPGTVADYQGDGWVLSSVFCHGTTCSGLLQLTAAGYDGGFSPDGGSRSVDLVCTP